jgi:hypothetical protein
VATLNYRKRVSLPDNNNDKVPGEELIMEVLVVLLVLVAASAVFIVMRGKARNPKTAASRTNEKSRAVAGSKTAVVAPRHPYRATSIVFDDAACDAVKALGRKRFLDRDRDVPKLPLKDCSNSQCSCKYAHHDDRRDSSEDRRHPSALKSELYERGSDPNRRQKKRGRRKSDWA